MYDDDTVITAKDSVTVLSLLIDLQAEKQRLQGEAETQFVHGFLSALSDIQVLEDAFDVMNITVREFVRVWAKRNHCNDNSIRLRDIYNHLDDHLAGELRQELDRLHRGCDGTSCEFGRDHAFLCSLAPNTGIKVEPNAGLDNEVAGLATLMQAHIDATAGAGGGGADMDDEAGGAAGEAAATEAAAINVDAPEAVQGNKAFPGGSRKKRSRS